MFYSTKCALLQKFSSLCHSSVASMTLPTNTTLSLPSNEGYGHGSLILKDIQQVWASRRNEGQDCERLEAGKLNAGVCSLCHHWLLTKLVC